MNQETGNQKDITFGDNDLPSSNGDGESPAYDDIPKEQRHLRTQAYDKSIGDVVSMIEDGEIVLDPEYQRNYVWDNKKASLLMESILLNVPIPVIYVAEDPDGKWNVVDGLQRLYSLKRFFCNELKLRGLEVLSELNGLQYSTLNPKAARMLRNGILRIILIFKESHPEIKYEIFMRLNRGAIKLKEQELRNCLYRGKLNSLLKSLKQNKHFLEMLGLAAPHRRMDDEELILRYLALSEGHDPVSGTVNNYNGKMKASLNTFMEKKRNVSTEEITSYTRKFNDTVEKVFSVFGRNAFRRINPDGTYDDRPNRAIMDVILLSFETKTQEELISKKAEIATLLQELPVKDALFYSSITIATSDKKQLEYRLRVWNQNLENLLGYAVRF